MPDTLLADTIRVFFPTLKENRLIYLESLKALQFNAVLCLCGTRTVFRNPMRYPSLLTY